MVKGLSQFKTIGDNWPFSLKSLNVNILDDMKYNSHFCVIGIAIEQKAKHCNLSCTGHNGHLGLTLGLYHH